MRCCQYQLILFLYLAIVSPQNISFDIYIKKEMSRLILLPIMDVTKLLLTTPELRILISVHFDYLWVVFFSGFQQYTMIFRTTQVKMNFLTMHAFILYFHFSNTITDSSEKPPQMAFTTSTSQ